MSSERHTTGIDYEWVTPQWRKSISNVCYCNLTCVLCRKSLCITLEKVVVLWFHDHLTPVVSYGITSVWKYPVYQRTYRYVACWTILNKVRSVNIFTPHCQQNHLFLQVALRPRQQVTSGLWLCTRNKKVAQLQRKERKAPFLSMYLTYITLTYVTFRNHWTMGINKLYAYQR